MGAFRPGDVLTDSEGTRLVVVDRWQKNQTRGYWITGETEEGMVWIKEDRWKYFSWNLEENYPSRIWPAAYPDSPPCLCLCHVSEVDAPETNEWGLVLP